jgi:hypothetical protein
MSIALTCDKLSKIVRLSNLSDTNIYWTCPSLDTLNYSNKKFKSNKLEPGQTTVVFNLDLIEIYDSINSTSSNRLIESNIVNISLGKYWGHDSIRNSIELCPHWLNISINKDYFI